MRAQDTHDRGGQRPVAAPPVSTGVREAGVARLAYHDRTEPCLASTIPRPTFSNSCSTFIRRARRSRPANEVKRESFVAKGYGAIPIGPGQFDTQTITIHGFRQADDQQYLPENAFSIRGL